MQPPGAVVSTAPAAPTNRLALGSAIVGALSWFVCPIVGAVAAVVMGHTAKGEIRRTHEAGWGLATAGQVLGYAHLLVYGLVLLIFLSVCGGLAAIGSLGSAVSH
jgi:hypothetical protein